MTTAENLDEKNIQTSLEKAVPLSLSVFFEKLAPYTNAYVKIDLKIKKYNNQQYRALSLPTLTLHCTKCNGERFFSPVNEEIELDRETKKFVSFVCKNCSCSVKTFAISASISKDMEWATIYKYGEMPQFGPPTPTRLISLLGSEKEYFLKGRRCELQGLGIAAFTYYRRIIEEKRNAIFDEIIKVAQKLDASEEMIADLSKAKIETQFSKAIETIKHGIPSMLLINGHNPLTLLHSALSEGLHAKTDEECLGYAESIRLLLFDFVEKLKHALKTDAEINQAVNRLIQSKIQKK